MKRDTLSTSPVTIPTLAVVPVFAFLAAGAVAQEHDWSTPEDFATGTLERSVPADPVGIQLESTTTQHDFVWVAKTRRNTIVRIDAVDGAILGEYRTAPEGAASAPTGTVVDREGNVWVANSDEAAGGRGSVVKLGVVIGGTRVHKNADGSIAADPNGGYLAPPFVYSTAVDRDSDGLIHTSRGAGDLLGWPIGLDWDGGPDGRVEQPVDECILVFQRTSFPSASHVALSPRGEVWVGGYNTAAKGMDQLDPQTGSILDSMYPECGGFSGISASSGILWSTSWAQSTVLRFDPENGASRCIVVPTPRDLAIDSQGNIWCTTWVSNTVVKLTADGTLVDGFPKPSGGGRSCAIVVANDGTVWVANQSTGNVSHLDSNGNLLKRIATGSGPSGIDIDARGQIWVTHLNHHNVVRINPQAGLDGLGAVDLSIPLGSLAGPDNLGSMAAHLEVLRYASSGSWSAIFDSKRHNLSWQRLSWETDLPEGTEVSFVARAHDDLASLSQSPWVPVPTSSESNLAGVVGRFFEVQAHLRANPTGTESPLLRSVHVDAVSNQAPDCATAHASVAVLWPPNHRMVPVAIEGVVDPDGDPVTIAIAGIMQDEPLTNEFDGAGVGDTIAHLRATRQGGSGHEGNGRVYQVEFTARDGHGGESSGRVFVCVPHDSSGQGTCLDDGLLWDSTGGLGAAARATGGGLKASHHPNPFNPSTTITFDLAQAGFVRLIIYDTRGQIVRRLLATQQSPGAHAIRWDGRDDHGEPVASGVYVYHLTMGEAVVSNRLVLVK